MNVIELSVLQFKQLSFNLRVFITLEIFLYDSHFYSCHLGIPHTYKGGNHFISILPYTAIETTYHAHKPLFSSYLAMSS